MPLTSDHKITVSVIICTYNGEERLPETLKHLALQTTPAECRWNLIVVDNGSTDSTVEMVRNVWPSLSSVPLSLVFEPRQGKVNAILAGFEHCDDEFAVFVDDDNWLDPDWIATAVATMRSEPSLGACSGYNRASFEGEMPSWFPKVSRYYAVGSQHFPGVTEHLWGAGLCVRMEAWQGLADRNFSFLLQGRTKQGLVGGSDTELSLALRLLGWRLAYCPSLQLTHFMPANRMNPKHLLRLAWGNGAIAPTLDAYRHAIGEADGRYISLNKYAQSARLTKRILFGLLSLGSWVAQFEQHTLRLVEMVANLTSLLWAKQRPRFSDYEFLSVKR